LYIAGASSIIGTLQDLLMRNQLRFTVSPNPVYLIFTFSDVRLSGGVIGLDKDNRIVSVVTGQQLQHL